MKILTVEDDKFFQKFYTTKLSERGYEVIIAANGREGLQKAKETLPDVILLDIIMPEMDGFEVLELIKKDEALKNIPIIVFSTLGQEKDIQKAMGLGATDYVNKSLFDFESLVQKIEALKKKQP